MPIHKPLTSSRLVPSIIEDNIDNQNSKTASNNNISNKVNQLIRLVSGIALLITICGFILLDTISYHRNIIQQLYTLSDVVGDYAAAAIYSNDIDTSTGLISSLQKEPMIVTAILYKTDWREFTSIQLDNSINRDAISDMGWPENLTNLEKKTHKTTITHINTLKPIYYKNEIIAYLYIKSSLKPLFLSLYNRLIFGLLVWLTIMYGINYFSKNLHRNITVPIRRLISGMKEMSQQHDYKARLPDSDDDDISNISNVVNDLMGQVQNRNERLNQYRKKLEDEVEMRTQELRATADDAIKNRDIAERSAHAKSEFLATMSHEIRTPMNGVLGMAEMMMHTDLTTKQKKYITTIQKSGEVLLMVINDILDFSRIEAGQLELESRNFNVAELVDNVIDMLRAQASSKGLMLYHTLPPTTNCIVSGDSNRLTQILVNLISNAIKFTESGKVSVSLEVHDIDSDTKKLQFKVSDTGIGIEADKQPNVFNAFVQGDGSMARKHGGTGLGLAISQKLAKLMGGELHVESELGQGSVFAFNLVIDTATDVDEQVSIDNTPLEGRADRASILLVEDNEMNQEVATEMLNLMGCTVDIANNGEEAVQMSQQGHYDTILMDCQMPIKDGFEATKDIRRLEEDTDHHHYIIALTGNALIGDKERCLKAGMDNFISKPFSYDQLENVLRANTIRN